MSGFFRYSVSRWFASMSTSWTMSEASTRRAMAGSSRRSMTRRSGLAELAEQLIHGARLARAGVVEQPVGLVAVGPHAGIVGEESSRHTRCR